MAFGTRHRITSLSYAHRRWPVGAHLVPTQLSPVLSQLSLYDICLMAGLSRPSRTRRGAGISHGAIKALCKAQNQRQTGTPYHNQAHIKGVIIAAALLANEAQISQIERDLLITASLMHDFHHLGRWRHKAPYWQEAMSADKALAICARHGMDSRLHALFTEMILRTSPHDKTAHSALRGNDILSLLLDADLFGSLFLPKAQTDKLTAQLKYEDRITASHERLRDGFIESCQAKGLASLAGQALHRRLPTDRTYFKS